MRYVVLAEFPGGHIVGFDNGTLGWIMHRVPLRPDPTMKIETAIIVTQPHEFREGEPGWSEDGLYVLPYRYCVTNETGSHEVDAVYRPSTRTWVVSELVEAQHA